MTIKISFTAILAIAGVSILSACAATPETQTSTPIAEAKAEAPVVVETPVPATKTEDLSPDPVTTKVAEDKEVCKRQPVLGSRFNRKVCMKQSQWDALEEDGRRTTGDIQRKGSSPGVTN